jgi:Flp pilus assembly protein TadB
MAETCKGMMAKPGSGFWMILPGVVFIALGVAIIVFPQILVWLVAFALIGMGLGMLIMMNFMRNVGKRLQNRA